MRDYQAVLSNAAVNAWFLMELTKCEAEFHLSTDRYIDSPTITKWTCKTAITKALLGCLILGPILLKKQKPKYQKENSIAPYSKQ
jgi:hypothetical protein